MEFQYCIGCRLCKGCPMMLDIPEILAAYNRYTISGNVDDLAPIRAMAGDRQPKSCVGCGLCMEKCPQRIDIPGIMLKLSAIDHH